MEPSAITGNDPRYAEPASYNALERIGLGMIRDPRDLPFMKLGFQIMAIQLPFAIALFLPGVFRWWLAGIYLALTFLGFTDRYILMLHNISHRPPFKKGYGWLQKVFVWIMGPLNGETPETYYSHHICMHHAEENLKNDLSSTMPFKRDNPLHFLFYWGRFFFFIVPELSVYFIKRGNYKQLRRMIVGEFSYYAVVAVGLYFAWQPTLVTLVIPVVTVRFLMMAGNWSQHAFIDPDHPEDPLRSSITCINARYNRRCFNDGYHIGHHEMAARHWTDMPADFDKKKQKYIDHDAIVFEGLDYFVIWILLMLRRYKTLANKFVDLREEKRSLEEIEAMLRERVKPVPFASAAPQPAE